MKPITVKKLQCRMCGKRFELKSLHYIHINYTCPNFPREKGHRVLKA